MKVQLELKPMKTAMQELIDYMEENFHLTEGSRYEFKKALKKEREQIEAFAKAMQAYAQHPPDIGKTISIEPQTTNEFLHETLIKLLRLGDNAMIHMYDSLGSRLPKPKEVSWDEVWLKYIEFSNSVMDFNASTKAILYHNYLKNNYKLIKK